MHGFLVDYHSIDSDVLDIHKCLMKKYDIK